MATPGLGVHHDKVALSSGWHIPPSERPAGGTGKDEAVQDTAENFPLFPLIPQFASTRFLPRGMWGIRGMFLPARSGRRSIS